MCWPKRNHDQEPKRHALISRFFKQFRGTEEDKNEESSEMVPKNHNSDDQTTTTVDTPLNTNSNSWQI